MIDTLGSGAVHIQSEHLGQDSITSPDTVQHKTLDVCIFGGSFTLFYICLCALHLPVYTHEHMCMCAYMLHASYKTYMKYSLQEQVLSTMHILGTELRSSGLGVRS